MKFSHSQINKVFYRPLEGRYMAIEYKVIHQNVKIDVHDNEEFISLQDYSKKDVKWDTKKRNAVSVQAVFKKSENPNVQKYSKRTAECANG